MKWTLLVLTAATAAIGLALAENPRMHLFVESMQQLHQPPQLPRASNAATKAITTEFIEQKLDHFNESDTRTWQMRYMINAEHYINGGPIFIFVGGEWTITPELLSYGHFYDMAKEHHAIMYYTEHRFFGESMPFNSLSVQNLLYMDVKQALADLAYFVSYKQASAPALTDSKVIMQGASYSGNMVVWFKQLYPELLDGAWAMCAPLLAQVDFYEFKEMIGLAMRELGSQQCYDRIQNGIAEMEYMLANGRGAEVKALFKLCSDFNEYNDLDMWILFSTYANIFTLLAQLQQEGDIPIICQYLLHFDDDLTATTNLFMDFFGHPLVCNELTYQAVLPYYFLPGNNEMRTVLFMLCEQFGWFPSTTSKQQPFGTKVPITLYTTLCADVFGDEYSHEHMNVKIAATNSFFGGKNPQVENIYMSQGGMDPWLPMCLSEAEGATVIPRVSHVSDFESISDTDSAEMRASKERVAELVRQWLNEGKTT